MASRLKIFRSVFRRAPRCSRSILPRPFATLPTENSIEEETLPHYNPEHFYPVQIGDVFNDRYRIAGKLGYGAHSTSWLCRDLQNQQYAVLKVSISREEHPTATDREFKIYEHLSKLNSAHPGQSLIREVYDSFELQGQTRSHRCLILQPMYITLLEMMSLNPKPFNMPLLKMTLRRLLLALDLLHSEAGIVHTDLKTDNIMLSIEDDTMLADFANEATCRQAGPRKQMDESRSIYRSQRFRRPLNGKGYGLPILCDFGEARIGSTHESGPFVKPSIYRAPEVIFEMPWGSAVDIWNLGALVWDLFEGQHLFADIFDPRGCHDPFKHLALMVALIGPPSADFFQRSETAEQCFDTNGVWIADEDAAIPQVSLESLEQRLSGSDKEQFLRFLRSMLKWLPKERKTAKQLLEDPWLL